MPENGLENTSTIACHVCRKRKIKCGRELPACSICQVTAQDCTYPARAAKPGPPIGSVHKKRSSEHETDQAARSKRSAPRRNRHDNNGSAHEGKVGSDESGEERMSEPSTGPRALETRSKDMQSLAFILHPSHESVSPEDDADHGQISSVILSGNEEPFTTATCFALGISPSVLSSLLTAFFDTFTSYRLFRQRSFNAKLRVMESGAHINALLSAMAAFGAKNFNRDADVSSRDCSALSERSLEERLIVQAFDHIDTALRDCGDDVPSLALLQALILSTHWLLVQGVKGRAWRYLGTCVRIAYELNLHLVDSGEHAGTSSHNTSHWCEDEERRRAWWAIWEMDILASVVRRCPTAIDWSQNETLLPAEDRRWAQGEPQPSCFLESGLIDRCKALTASGNKSPTAWFIVVNSLAREAQRIVSPISTDSSRGLKQHDSSDRRNVLVEKLDTIHNALRYFQMSLPSALKLHGQHLDFDDNRSDDIVGSLSNRQSHASTYSICMMIELTKLMIHKYRVFNHGPPLPVADTVETRNSNDKTESSRTSQLGAMLSVNRENSMLKQFFHASDNVLKILHHSSENHYRYVNPFLVNTIWLATGAQLLRRELYLGDGDGELAASNVEVLYMTYQQFESFWGMSVTQRLNLDAISQRLKSFRITGHGEATAEQRDPRAAFSKRSRTTSTPMQRASVTAAVSGNKRGSQRATQPSVPPIPPPSNNPVGDTLTDSAMLNGDRNSRQDQSQPETRAWPSNLNRPQEMSQGQAQLQHQPTPPQSTPPNPENIFPLFIDQQVDLTSMRQSSFPSDDFFLLMDNEQQGVVGSSSAHYNGSALFDTMSTSHYLDELLSGHFVGEMM